MEKTELRKQGLKKRREIPDRERARLDAAINGAITGAEAFLTARTVLCYRAFDGEPCLDSAGFIANMLKKRVVYPRCISKTQLEARLPENPGAFVAGSFGILEPDPDRSAVIPPEEIDLVLLPAAAFDTDKNRIGMGAGCYDRYLPRCVNAAKLLVAYECQRVEGLCPDGTDVPADFLVTEKGIR